MKQQGGFTLIEVTVAFAVFALCMTALCAAFSEADRREHRAVIDTEAVLTAQSLLARLRAGELPWRPVSSGITDQKWFWEIEVSPFGGAQRSASGWSAFLVTVRVGRVEASLRSVLRSVEVAREAP